MGDAVTIGDALGVSVISGNRLTGTVVGVALGTCVAPGTAGVISGRTTNMMRMTTPTPTSNITHPGKPPPPATTDGCITEYEEFMRIREKIPEGSRTLCHVTA